MLNFWNKQISLVFATRNAEEPVLLLKTILLYSIVAMEIRRSNNFSACNRSCAKMSCALVASLDPRLCDTSI
jgi:hypothetical protein